MTHGDLEFRTVVGVDCGCPGRYVWAECSSRGFKQMQALVCVRWKCGLVPS